MVLYSIKPTDVLSKNSTKYKSDVRLSRRVLTVMNCSIAVWLSTSKYQYTHERILTYCQKRQIQYDGMVVTVSVTTLFTASAKFLANILFQLEHCNFKGRHLAW